MNVEVSRRLLHADRDRLLRVRRALEDELVEQAGSGANAHELSPLDQHQADTGSEMFEREKEAAILGRIDAALQDVDDALDRLERDAYGACQTCGATIPDDRLEAVPATRFCAAHEVLWEGNQMTFELPEGLWPTGGAHAEDIAGREALRHLEFLPTDDEVDELLEIGPEESALHATTGASGASSSLGPAEVELAELRDADREDAARRAEQGS